MEKKGLRAVLKVKEEEKNERITIPNS